MTTSPNRERGSVEKPHCCDDLLLHGNEVCFERSNNVRRISDLHRGERRQTSEHHEQCCVVEKKSLEEPWAFERVVKFINLLGFREPTLNIDTEPAFRNRVAEMCKAEITTEDGVKGDKVEWAHREHGDAAT